MPAKIAALFVCLALASCASQPPNRVSVEPLQAVSAAGSVKIANGRARIVDAATIAKLEVSFFGPFWGDYWIIKLADDYSLSIVSEPEGGYLWILSRTPKISDAVMNDGLEFLRGESYDVSKLYYPEQPPAA